MTIRELAQRCGVSNATVSLALRGSPRISKATRERIARMAEKVGYHTPPMVAAWLSHVRGTRPPTFQESIALLTTEPIEIARRRTYHREVARGVVERAARLGYTIDSFRIDDQLSDQRLDQVLRSRGIRGLIIDSSCQDRNLSDLSWDRLCGVMIANDNHDTGMRQVVPDHYHNMTLLLRTMAARGYQRIGFYNFEDFENHVHGQWASAFTWFQRRIPARQRVAPEIARRWNAGEFVRWVDRRRPDGVICPHWEAAAWLRQAGWAVPDDIGVAVPNWNPQFPDVAGIDQNARAIGAAALDVVTAQMTRNETVTQARPRTTLIAGEFREGKTLRPVAA